MGNEFQDMSTTPTLTLDPFQAQEQKKPPVAQQEEPALDDSVLTEEERRMVDSFAQQIDLTNSALVLQYGAGTQKKMADFSESALENVRSKDLGEVGDLLSGVVTELKSFDEEEEKGFLGFFKKASNKIESMKAKYAKAEENVNEIVKALEKHQVQLMKDTALLDKMYELNLTYFKELSMYILAGKKKLAEVRGTQLAQLTQKAQASGLPEDAPRHEHMRKDLRMLLRCNAIVLCSGWERSEGCLLECSVAKQCAMRITYADLPVDKILMQLDTSDLQKGGRQ